MRSAFTLLEVSIVLVILGLLVGAITAGRSLIHSSVLQSVAKDFVGFQGAVNSFKDKYSALPGDFSMATQFWGHLQGGDPTYCVNNSHAADTKNGACDGNGDGKIGTCYLSIQLATGNHSGWDGYFLCGPGIYNDPNKPQDPWNNVKSFSANPGEPTESEQFFHHLALAGFVDVDPGGTVTASNSSFLADYPSKLPNVAYMANTSGSPQQDSSLYQINYGTWVGTVSTTNGGNSFTPIDAYYIDAKIDDGKPAYGRIVSSGWDSRINPNCSEADAGAAYSHYDNLAAHYRVQDGTHVNCQLYLRNL